jgi:Cryptococcal mannosyltransferase 1
MVPWTFGQDIKNHSKSSFSFVMFTQALTSICCSMTVPDTAHLDVQLVLTSIEQLLSLNGWVAALCPTLTRPFGQNKDEDAYDDLIRENNLYYFAIIIHSADHFLVDQLAVIVQMVRRLGPSNVFVSMLDYDSSDSTETLVDLCEAVMTLLGVSFRIRRVPGMTTDPVVAYYPLEEAHMRNLALEPLRELYQKRKIKFNRVVWLKGFTCPNDILETLKVSMANEAAMVCGMDWAEHGGFFIFSDRYTSIFLKFAFFPS